MAAKKNMSIENVVSLLIELQQINKEINVLLQDINSLRSELDLHNKRFEMKKSQHDKHYPYLQKTEKEYKSLEIEIKIINEKIAKSEEVKKKIKTIKEFKSINKEIEFLIKESAIKENELLSKLNNLDFRKEKVEKIAEQIKEIEDSIALKSKDIDTLTVERQELINQKTKEKEALESKLSPSVVKVFNRIYANREQKAIVPLIQQVCNGCYIKIPLQDEFNIRKGDGLSFCPYCSRIIYYQD